MASPARSPTPTRHRKVGAYRILGELGRGGMACVYHGLHEGLQREVALKELISQSRDAESLSRFRREALALAGFRHQNIVTLYDLVEKGDSLFMVLEHVDGGTLRELLQTGPLPPPVAAVIGLQLADALNHAHFRRIVHRDLKPANIMLTRAGEVKLMDFGVAKDEEMEALTQEGMAVGTPAYMAPEQVMGQAVDARTDLFALGVVLYECLAGKRPFTGRTTGETFANIRDGKYPALHKVAPDVPRVLCDVVKKALQPNPEKRYFDAAEMARALERYVSGALSMGHNQLLMACLHQRGKLTETEALAHLTRQELEQASRLESATADPEPISVDAVELLDEDALVEPVQRGGFGFWMSWLLVVGGAGAVAWATHDAWWPEFIRWLSGLGR